MSKNSTLCDFAWFDGRKGHVCREDGEHDRHQCSYCLAKHDPLVRLTWDERTGFRAVRDPG